MRPIAADVAWSVCLSVCLSVSLLVTTVSYAKTAKQVEVPFGPGHGWTQRTLYQVDAQGPSEEKATFCGISLPVVKYVSQNYSRGGSSDAARGSQYCTSCYSAPVRGAEYCDERVCLSVSVCLSVRDRIFGTTRPIFANCFVHVSYGRGSVFLWRRSDTLCASGFINDVIFAHRPRLLEVAALLKHSAHAALGLAVNCAQ